MTTQSQRRQGRPPKNPAERFRTGKTVQLSPDQFNTLRLIVMTRDTTVSAVVEAAFAWYIPRAFAPLAWPHVERRTDFRLRRRKAPTCTVVFTLEQDQVLQRIQKEHLTGYSELFELAMAAFVPVEYGDVVGHWPATPRFSLSAVT